MKSSDSLILSLARNLRAVRLEADMTQEQLAELAGLHRTYVGSIERGERNVSLRNVEKLAVALGVGPCELLCESQPRGKR